MSGNSIIIDDVFEVKDGVLVRYIGACPSVVVIPEGVTGIGNGAFEYQNLEQVTLPSSLTSIGDRAFEVCSNLKIVNGLEHVASIGDGAFYRCENLEKLVLLSADCKVGDTALIFMNLILVPSLPILIIGLRNAGFLKAVAR